MKSLFLTQCVALSLSTGIGLGSILIGAEPSEAEVTIGVTGGSVVGFDTGILQFPTGTLITPYGVYTGPFSAREIMLGTNTGLDSYDPDFEGNAYVNGTSTPFSGRLDLTVDSPFVFWSPGNISKTITGGTIFLDTPNTLTGFSFEAPVAPPTPVDPLPTPVDPSPTPVTPSPTPVTPLTTTTPTPAPTATPSTPTPSTIEIPQLTATTFTIPEPLTEPGGPGQSLLRSQGQQPQQFRPNGVHTRIIPTWTPGLYQ